MTARVGVRSWRVPRRKSITRITLDQRDETRRSSASTSGLRPRSSEELLAGMSISDLQSAITQDRVTDLTQIRGVGRKTAERVVVELRDKIASIAGATGSVSATGPVDQGVTAEAILALVALGINESTATKSVDKAMKKSDGEATVQDLIKNALRDR